MLLATAAKSFVWDWGKQLYFNPLWRFIGKPFSDKLIARDGDADFTPDLYVETRALEGGVTPDDIFAHVESGSQALFLVQGQAGIGKTTFLRHVLRNQSRIQSWQVVYLNLDNQLDVGPGLSVREQVQKLISIEFAKAITADPITLEIWQRFVLQYAPDASGAIATLRIGVERDGTPKYTSELANVMSDLRRAPLDLLRLQVHFVKARLSRRPVVVVDNCDQLPAEALREVADVCRQLAEGPRKGSADDAIQTAHVILALRPVSFRKASDSTSIVASGYVTPPVINEVLRRRLDKFMEQWPSRVAPIVMGDGSLTQQQVQQIVGSGASGSINELAKQLLRTMVETLLSASTVPSRADNTQSTAGLVHTLLNHNTRLCLLATGHYVASGHIDMRDVFGPAREAGIRRAITPHKALRAFMLGTRPIYAPNFSWVVNLLNDGHGNDPATPLVRCRILAYVAGTRSTEVNRAVDNLAALFGYDKHRLKHTWEDLKSFALLEDSEHDSCRLTVAGSAYWMRMMKDFEYLQQISVDVPVGEPNVVPCEKINEPVELKFERVLRVTEWIRGCEANELTLVGKQGLLAQYEDEFGRQTIAGRMAEALIGFIDERRRSGDRWASRLGGPDWLKLSASVERLAQSATFDSIRAPGPQANVR